ncbi:MAG: FMN-binding protein [Actinomycetota bacterium]
MEVPPVEEGAASDQAPEPPAGPAPLREKKSGKKKLMLGMAISLVVMLLIAGLIGGLYAWRFLAAADDLAINDVDVTQVPDGTYEGSYSVFHVKAAVAVDVEGGRITSIAFTDSGRMAEETQQEIQEVFDEVISSQTLQVDIASGASVSKKVSLKAVEEALAGGE